MTLYDLERCNSLYFAFFSPNSTDFEADYITVVEDRPTVRKILSHISSLLLLAKTITAQRCLSAIAEHLVFLCSYSTGCWEAVHDEFLLAEPCKCHCQ